MHIYLDNISFSYSHSKFYFHTQSHKNITYSSLSIWKVTWNIMEKHNKKEATRFINIKYLDKFSKLVKKTK